MKRAIIDLLSVKLVLHTLIIFSIVMGLFFAVFIFKWRTLPRQLPLFYSLPRGEDQLGSPEVLLILPLLSLVIFIMNFLIGATIYSSEKLAAKLLVIAGAVSTILFFITFVKIIFLIS